MKEQTLYQQEGKRLVSVYPADLQRLDGLLTAKLRLFGYALPDLPRASEASPQHITQGSPTR